MKATGIVRRIDELGRVVVPRELRKSFDIKEGDPLEIFTDKDGQIILKKYQPGCISCGRNDNLRQLPNGSVVCTECLKGAK